MSYLLGSIPLPDILFTMLACTRGGLGLSPNARRAFQASTVFEVYVTSAMWNWSCLFVTCMGKTYRNSFTGEKMKHFFAQQRKQLRRSNRQCRQNAGDPESLQRQQREQWGVLFLMRKLCL